MGQALKYIISYGIYKEDDYPYTSVDSAGFCQTKYGCTKAQLSDHTYVVQDDQGQ